MYLFLKGVFINSALFSPFFNSKIVLQPVKHMLFLSLVTIFLISFPIYDPVKISNYFLITH